MAKKLYGAFTTGAILVNTSHCRKALERKFTGHIIIEVKQKHGTIMARNGIVLGTQNPLTFKRFGAA